MGFDDYLSMVCCLWALMVI